MKVYLKSDGGLIVGDNEISRTSPTTLTWFNNDTSVKIAPTGSNEWFYKGLITGLSDESDVAYADKAALIEATKDFFFRVGGVSADGFFYLPTSISTQGIRIGERTGFIYAIDRALTAIGFSPLGVEGTDWENIGGQGTA